MELWLPSRTMRNDSFFVISLCMYIAICLSIRAYDGLRRISIVSCSTIALICFLLEPNCSSNPLAETLYLKLFVQ